MPDAEHGTFPTWPIGGGEMGALIRALDWTQTPLGPIEGWPQSLHSAVAICLGSSSAIGIYWGGDLTLIYNDAWRELVGDKHPSALGRPARDVFPEIWETIGPMFAHVLSTGEATGAEEQRLPLFRHGFYEECYFDYTFNPLPHEDGSVGGIFNIAVEVTERVRTEKALRESEARYRGIVDQATVGIAQSDLTGKITFVNDRFCEIVGRSREELLGGLRMQEITHEEDLLRNRLLFDGLVDHRAGLSIEKRYVRPNGEQIWIENEVTLVLGADGRPLYAQAITQDITRRRQAEEALRKSEERLQLAIDAAQLGRWELVPKTGEFFTSAICNRHLGLPPDAQPTHEDHFETIHPDDHEMIYRRLRQAVEESGEFEVEYRTLHPGGAVRWIMSRARVVRDRGSASARFIGVTLDMTEHREAEEERARLRALELSARAEAEERERISRELHDRVAHSMGVAYQSLQLYETYARSEPSRAAQKLDLAKEAIRAALEQTRDLSAELMRMQETETEHGLVPALRTLLDSCVPEGVRADLSSSGDELQLPKPLVAQMYLIMREAVRNAVEHSGCGRVGVGFEVRQEEVLGYVEDDGSGFDPYEVGENVSPSGIGLRSMRDRSELLGGELHIASKRGGGTRLEILVPLGERQR